MTTIRTANHAFATAAPGKALNIALWTLQVLVALARAATHSQAAVRAGLGLSVEAVRIAIGHSTVAPAKGDHRFADPTWTDKQFADEKWKIGERAV